MASPNKEAVPAPVPEAEVGSVQAGEYLIHVYVEETRALRHPIHDDETVDPIIQVTAFNKKRLSKAKSKVGSGGTFWGEHFFFEGNFKTKYEVESQRITISVMDHNSFGSDALIGSVELSLSAVYMKDKHCMEYQWAALAGLTKNFQKVLGFLKFSIGAFGPGDKQVTFDQEKALDANTKSLQVLYPPQITTQPYQLVVKAFRGEQLKKMDTFGQCDPYVKVEYGSTVLESSVKKVTLEPIWCEDLLVPLSMPTINNRLVIKLLDWEQVGTHEILGSTIFNIEDIKAGKYKNPFWANIYGSHTGAKSDWAAIMNSVPETATEWKGRVQIAIRLEENEHPELKCMPTKDTKTVEIANRIQRENYELKAEIHVAFNLPKNGVKYFVKIRWGKSEVTSKKKESKDRMIEIYESLFINEQFPVGPLGEEEIPDVFIYLNDGDKDFSFIRQKVSVLNDPTTKTKSIFFQNDKSMTNKRDDLAGVVKMRVYAGKAGQNKQLLSQYGWDRNVEKRVASTGWKIQLNVYQARNIISGDSTGTSDPYLNVYFGGYESKTTVINNTTNPMWNEKLEFSGLFNTVDEAAPFMLTLWDEDSGGLGDDFLGSAIINVDQSCLNPEDLPKPKWLTFRYGKDGRKAGELLYSLCCYNIASLIPRSPYIEPDCQKYYINMKILGLRSLESVGLLPVKKAWVRFDIDSLRRRQERSALPEKKALRTEPLDPGSNPNILTVINVEANLPIDPDFCPALTSSVFDYIFKGASQPLIGNFSIPLGDFIKQTQIELEKRVEILSGYYRAKQSEKGLGRDDTTQIKEEEEPKDEDEPLNPAGQDQEVEIVVESGPQKTIEELLKSEDSVERAKASRRFIAYPKYDKDGLEIIPPEADKFMALGHDKKDQSLVKHYRYLVPQELEKSGLIDASPFAKIPIYRGKSTLDEGFFSKLFHKSEEQKTVGYFKAMINVMSENDKMRFDSKIAAVSQIANTKRFEFSDEEFLKKRDVIVRLYIIDAEGLPDRDDESNSDPYLVVQLGDTVFNESKNWQLDCSDPKFYKCYEFSTFLPGASQLKISLWDHDDLDADDLIGSTSIDLEDRWYSTTWRSLKHVPVETRELFDPSSSIPKGKVRLWVEILPKDLKRGPIWGLAPKPSMDFELRVVVWECKDVPKVDTLEDAVDIYATATLADGQEQRTDTHFRSTNGKGSFNWRMVFPLALPQKKNRISFKLWDKDLLTKNDFISEVSFDFDSFADRAFEKEEIVNVMQGKDSQFWLPCTTIEVVDGKNVTTTKGSILVSMMIVPKRVAQLSPVGHGRSNPNQNPYLPPPVGRLHLSWNPLKMLEQFIGPVARRKAAIVCCAIFCVFVFLMTLPTFFATELAVAI